MAAKSAAEMVIVLMEALQTGAGVVQVQIDGRVVQYNREQAIKELRFWQREQSRAEGRRPMFARVRLG
jgi:hypothetical protein